MRRLPTINNIKSKQVGAVNRSKRLVPYQSKISVQDVPNYGTAEGSSMSNEEMRRLRLQDTVQAIKEEMPAGGETRLPYTSPSPIATTWSLTIKHDDDVIIKKKTRSLNFIDDDYTNKFKFFDGKLQTYPVQFGISSKLLSEEDVQSDAREAEIEAWILSPELKQKKGIVYINQLPLDPTGLSIPESELYKYKYFGYTPANGFYGWYVYGIIEHNFGLADINNFFITLIDTMSIDVTDGMEISPTILPEQIFIPQVAGLDENRIMIYGIYKPDLKYYKGENFAQQLYWINETERRVRTNIIYHYNLLSL